MATAQGIGASLSGLAAGLIVDHFGYGAAFVTSAGTALFALIVLALAMPEIAESERQECFGPSAASSAMLEP